MPESTHMLMWTMSDRALPRSLRTMEGFGVHTFKLVDAKGKPTFVKFHWKPVLGLQSHRLGRERWRCNRPTTISIARILRGHRQGRFPAMGVVRAGVRRRHQADKASASTRSTPPSLIPEEMIPLRKVGVMTLDRNPDNFFAETEQVAFLPTNVVPGIDFTDDPLLQGRLFSYLDTQKSRLGTTNFNQIPINAPKCPFHNQLRDGMMQTLVPKGRSNYEPNTLAEYGEDGGAREVKDGFRTEPTFYDEDGARASCACARNCSPITSVRRRCSGQSQTDSERAHIASAFVFELSKVDLKHVPPRVVANLRNVDEGLAQRVADGLGVALPPAAKPAREKIEMEPSPALSIQRNAKPTPERPQGRRAGRGRRPTPRRWWR